MQLVPTSGAREAYRYLYKQDRIVSDTYLYNPGNNIKLGTAYLNQLYYKYLAGIKNEQSRQWAMIAAYNTGPGNVFRSLLANIQKRVSVIAASGNVPRFMRLTNVRLSKYITIYVIIYLIVKRAVILKKCVNASASTRHPRGSISFDQQGYPIFFTFNYCLAGGCQGNNTQTPDLPG